MVNQMDFTIFTLDYMLEILYIFSPYQDTEIALERTFTSLINVNFMRQVMHFTGIKLNLQHHKNNIITQLVQETFAENVIGTTGLSDAIIVSTPYHTGYPLYLVHHQQLDPTTQSKLLQKFQT